MVVNHLYYNDAQPAGTPSQSFSFSPKLLQQALQNIYGPSFDPEKDIEPTFWQTFTKAFNQAADQGFSQSSYNPSQAFTSALRHSNAVFAAFKTHRLQNDLAQLLTDSNGNLKPFQQWKKDILPIASHQCQHWLQTEYDTAVLRAHQAADWQQFQAEKDVLPNLRWMPSTSPNPGADHLPFWNTVLPVDHPFWDQHRPGDRWNCKCSLSATDDPATSVPTAPASSAGGNRPHPGLDTNPGKTAQLFSNTHPYIKNAYPGAKEAVEKAVSKAEENERHWTKVRDLLKSGRFPVVPGRNQYMEHNNLYSGKLCVTTKKLRHLLAHTHTEEQKNAAEYIWNHPEQLHSPIKKDMEEYYRGIGMPEDVMKKKIEKKKKERKVVCYYYYKFSFKGEEWQAYLEYDEQGRESIYMVDKK